MFEDWSDEELVAETLKGKGREKSVHLDALFWRHFDRFEKTLRAVLFSYDIPFSDEESYYNNVFDEIYERVFEPRNFRRLASKFDPSRSSSFSRWFFGTVLPSRIIDWLRTKNRTRGETNRTYLKLKYPVRTASQEPGGGFENTGPNPATSQAPDAEETHKGLSWCVERLPAEDRVLIKLLFLGTETLHQDDHACLARLRGCEPEVLHRELASYETEFQARHESNSEKALRIDVDLGINHFLLLRNQRMVQAKVRDRHGVHGATVDFDGIRERFKGQGLTDVREKQKALDKQFRQGLLSGSEYRRDRSDAELAELLIYDSRLRRRMEGLVKEWDHLFGPVNKAVGAIMCLSSGSHTGGRGVVPSRFCQLKI